MRGLSPFRSVCERSEGKGAAQPQVPDKERARRRKQRRQRVITVLRRIHLYTGLILLPWVLLYGVTGFLFNHPTAVSPNRAIDLEVGELLPTSLVGSLNAEDLADRVLVAHAAQVAERAAEAASEGVSAGGSEGGVEGAEGEAVPDEAPLLLARTPNSTAVFDGTLQLEASTEERTHRLRVDATTGRGRYSDFGRRRRAPGAPFATRDLAVGAERHEAWLADGKELLEGLAGTPLEGERLRSGPVVSFPVTYDGKDYEARYDLATGSLEGVPADHETTLSARSFLLRLHLARTYPQGGGVRWFWAVFVDLMVISMVLWAFTGLVMWWQIKKTRRLGLLVLAATPVLAIALGIGMYSSFTS